MSLKAPGKTPQLAMPRAGAAIMAVDGIGAMDSKNANTVLSTASVAKAMTAYQILKDHPLKAGWYGPKITVTKAEASLFNKQARQGQSLVPVRAGEKITERDALEALLLASANNMAQILARWDGGTVPHFVDKMNASAKALGMTHTHYTDPSGFTATTKSTVADQIKLASGALKVQQYYAITSLRNAWIPVKGHIINFNKLLADPAVIGLKTGSMNAAGGCLLFTAKYKVNGKPVTLVSAVFNQRGPSGILTRRLRFQLQAAELGAQVAAHLQRGQEGPGRGHRAGHQEPAGGRQGRDRRGLLRDDRQGPPVGQGRQGRQERRQGRLAEGRQHQRSGHREAGCISITGPAGLAVGDHVEG